MLEGKLMWRGLRRARFAARQRQAQGLTLDDVERIVALLSLTEPHDVRDAALLTVDISNFWPALAIPQDCAHPTRTCVRC